MGVLIREDYGTRGGGAMLYGPEGEPIYLRPPPTAIPPGGQPIRSDPSGAFIAATGVVAAAALGALALLSGWW